MRLLAFLLVLALSPLAGCLDSAPLDVHEAGASALEARRIADAQARAWSPDAELVAMLGYEDKDGGEGAAAGEVFLDGRCVEYVFYYQAPDAERLWNVTVSGDGSVVFSGPADEEADPDEEPVRDWRVDSTDLVGVLRDEADGFAARADGGEVEHLTYVLLGTLDEEGLEHDGAVWVVLEDADGLFVHGVDAGNGTHLWSEAFSLDWANAFAEYGTFSGTLTAADPERAHRFVLQAPHGVVAFHLAADATVPTGTVTVNVTGPGVAHEETFAADLPVDGWDLRIEPAPQGEWTATVRLDGVALDYTLDYCTDGTGMFLPSPFTAHPCSRAQP